MQEKRVGIGLEMRTFIGDDQKTYLVFRTPRNAFHVFREVEAKDAARRCGATVEKNTVSMWKEVWKRVATPTTKLSEPRKKSRGA